MSELPNVALRFANALDDGAWAIARRLLVNECRYQCRGSETQGSTAIIESYQKVDEWVKATFERVVYQSQVEALDDGRAKIAFRDLIDHGEHHLDFRCEQVLTFGEDGRIVHIEHIDLPGELEKVEAFNRACGVKRPG